MTAERYVVNGLPLPAPLVALIEAGRWRKPSDVGPLRALTGLHDADDLLFCDVASMQRNTEQMIDELERGNPTLFGLASGRRSAAPVTDRSLLDVDLCVLIACTAGDGIVCLDYRQQPERPAVVVSEWGARPNGGVAWREIAADIEQLAARVGL